MSSKSVDTQHDSYDVPSKSEPSASDAPRRQSKAAPTPKRRSTLLFGAGPAAPAPHVPFRAPRSYPADTRMQSLLSSQDTNWSQKQSPKTMAALPSQVALPEWLAVNALFYYNQINDYYGYLASSDSCTCEKMTVGPRYEFLWADGKTIRNPINIPASDYIDYVMLWVEANFDDTRLFPDYDDGHYGKTYMETIKSVFKRLFRVLGHMVVDHEGDLKARSLDAPVERLLRCFVELVKKWKLMDKRQLRPIQKLMDNWKKA